MSWPGGGGGGGDHSEPDLTSSSPPRAPTSTSGPGPRLQVQRSLSRDTITIHFSAQGREDDEDDEELYGSPLAPGAVATAMEASEEFNSHEASSAAPHAHTPAVAILQPSPSPSSFSSSISSSWPSEAPQVPTAASTHPLSSSASPVRVAAAAAAVPASALPSKPFISLVKSLSSDVEPREPRETPAPPPSGGINSPSARQSQQRRHLMKTLVKSLSTDTARPTADTDSRFNRHLFKPFSQSRPGALNSAGPGTSPSVAGDSKTAPSSPLASPLDGRPSSSFFKVPEVEARIEDTRRRLSEVMSEPLQLLSKFMGEEGSGGSGVTAGAGPRTRTLSSSASELTSLAGLNGHPESSRYSIKEEEGDLEDESEERRESGSVSIPLVSRMVSCPGPDTTTAAPPPPPPRSPSLGLERCTMSALARQEDEEFCELYSEDFEQESDTETEGWRAADAQRRQSSLTGAYSQGDTDDEDDDDGDDDQEEERTPGVPHHSLLLLISVVYGYFVLPLPPYVQAVMMGMAAGFMLAILVVWLSAPRHSALTCPSLPRRRRGDRWNLTPLDIKEPGVFKVSDAFLQST